MKKNLIIFLFFIFFQLFNTAYAKSGDIAGTIYSTDILTYVNGMPEQGYNIGGKTAVILEDLSGSGSGFYCTYSEAERTLTATVAWKQNYVPVQKDIKRGSVGKILGNIYETDIKVILNGSEVKGYNIGGKTAVLIEDIGTVYDNPNARFGYSKYLCNFEWDAANRTVSLNSVCGYDHNGLSARSTELFFNDNVISAKYAPLGDYHISINYDSGFAFNNTEDFEKEKFILKPLYLEAGQKRAEIGVCYTTYDENYTEIFIQDIKTAEEMLSALKPLPIPAEEALKLFDDGIKFKTLDSVETEDYYFIAAQDLSSLNADSVYYISVIKNGGYITLYKSSNTYTSRIIEKTDKNTVTVTVSPFAGPHGATAMSMEFDLSRYVY